MIPKKKLFFYLLIVLVIGGLVAATTVLGIKSGKPKWQPGKDPGTLMDRLEACQHNADINEKKVSQLTEHLSSLQKDLKGTSCADGWIQLSGLGSMVGTGRTVCYRFDGGAIAGPNKNKAEQQLASKVIKRY
jgi:hypothetical protein